MVELGEVLSDQLVDERRAEADASGATIELSDSESDAVAGGEATAALELDSDPLELSESD